MRIPKHLAADAGLSAKSEVQVSMVDDSIVIKRINREAPTLEELLAQVTPENIHPETDWGPPVGREIW